MLASGRSHSSCFVLLCVCVEHLKRCKTSNRVGGFRFSFLILLNEFHFQFQQGAQKAHRAVPNEALYGVLRISRLITWTYLHPFFNSFDVIFLKSRPAKPRTGTSTNWSSNSFLHGFRNMNFHGLMNELHQNELYDFLRTVFHS